MTEEALTIVFFNVCRKVINKTTAVPIMWLISKVVRFFLALTGRTTKCSIKAYFDHLLDVIKWDKFDLMVVIKLKIKGYKCSFQRAERLLQTPMTLHDWIESFC